MPGDQVEGLAGNGLRNPFFLPPSQDVMRLVETFFAHTGRLFPYLHLGAIIELNNVPRPADPNRVNRARLCILNMIMAFASIHSPSKSSSIVDKLSRGNVFFYRALYILRSMQPTDVTLESGTHMPGCTLSILPQYTNKHSSVQATLLVAQYVQGTQRSAQTWSIASSAIYGALQIGLWRQPTVEGLGMSPLEAEVRKRTWWMCYMIDKSGLYQHQYHH